MNIHEFRELLLCFVTCSSMWLTHCSYGPTQVEAHRAVVETLKPKQKATRPKLTPQPRLRIIKSKAWWAKVVASKAHDSKAEASKAPSTITFSKRSVSTQTSYSNDWWDVCHNCKCQILSTKWRLCIDNKCIAS